MNAPFVFLIEGPAPKGPGLPEQLRQQVKGNALYAAAGVESRRRSDLIDIELTEEARRVFDQVWYPDFAKRSAELDDVLIR